MTHSIEVQECLQALPDQAFSAHSGKTSSNSPSVLLGVATMKPRRCGRQDVSFDVAEGEVVGIIGRNGAGKSTLLKILSKITYLTEGEIKKRARVALLLEVGTGFHEELTGREYVPP